MSKKPVTNASVRTVTAVTMFHSGIKVQGYHSNNPNVLEQTSWSQVLIQIRLLLDSDQGLLCLLFGFSLISL